MPGTWGSRWFLTARPRRGPPSQSPGPIDQIGTEPPGTLRQEDARGLLSFFAPGSQQKRCFTALGMTAGGKAPGPPEAGAFFAAFAPFPRGGGLFLPPGGVAPMGDGKLSFLSQSEEKCKGFSWKISTFCPLYFPTPSADVYKRQPPARRAPGLPP